MYIHFENEVIHSYTFLHSFHSVYYFSCVFASHQIHFIKGFVTICMTARMQRETDERRRWERDRYTWKKSNNKEDGSFFYSLFPALLITMGMRIWIKHRRPHIGFEFVSVSFLLVNKLNTYERTLTSFYWSSEREREKNEQKGKKRIIK